MVVLNLPWPVRGGGRLRNWQNVSVLAERTHLSVVAVKGLLCPPPPAKVLEMWLTLESELLREPIPFDPAEDVLRPDWWNNELGHPTDTDWSPFRASALRRLLKRHAFDFAVIEDITTWRYADIVNEFCPIVIDCHNVQSALESEYVANVPRDRTEELERRRIAFATMSLIEQKYREFPMIVCSERERELLHAGGAALDRIAVIHNTIEANDVPKPPRAEDSLPRILFPGVLNYAPNIMAALDLIEEIFPRVQAEIPEAALWIVGRNPTTDILLAARRHDSIFIIGEVGDTGDYFADATAVSVPLRFGGGTRFKILEAFNCRVPVVTSKKGCEGLDVADRHHVFLARSSDEHAQRLIELIRNPDLCASLTKEGYALLRRSYSFDTAERQWDACLIRFGLVG